MKTITYLRAGRKHRSTGTVCGANSLGQWVQPAHKGWKRVLVTKDEIAAGQEKPPCRPREKREAAKDTRQRNAKPAPKPRWMELVKEIRFLECPTVDGEFMVRMKISRLKELADELEAAHAKLAQFLPL